MRPKKQHTGKRWKCKAGNVFSAFIGPWGYMCFRETLQVNINGVCSKENCAHHLEVSNKENITHLSHPALTSVSPAAFSLSCVFHVIIKKMHFPSLLMQRTRHRISWKTRRPGSQLSKIKIIIRENEETVFLWNEKFSHMIYQSLGFVVKYVIVIQTRRRSREQELTMEINSISLPEPWSVILLH